MGALSAPILLLHGTADQTVPVQEARDYERALRERGKPVEAHYYEGAPHTVPFDPRTREDALRRSIAFFQRHLSQ